MRRYRWVVGVFLVFAVLMVDGYSKWLVHSKLPHIGRSGFAYPYGGVGIFEDILGVEFSITHATNTGTIWGLFGGAPKVLALVRLGILALLAIYWVRSLKEWRSWFPFSLIVAGALGNVIDVLLYGHVVDMFYVRFWGWSYPIFNVADAAICIGILWLLVSSGIKKKESGHGRQQTPSG